MRNGVILPWLIVLISCVGLAGCTGPAVRLMPTSDDTQAKTFTPKPDRANIYIYRSSAHPELRFKVMFDGKMVGALGIGSYLLLTVSPGDYTLFAECDNNGIYQSGHLTINADRGVNYFVRFAYGPWIWNPFSTKLLHASDGQKAVRGKRRAQVSLHYGELETHAPSGPEKTFRFVLKTTPCPARIIVNQNGAEQEIGTTPYVFQIGLAGHYNCWPIQEGNVTFKKYIHQEYVTYAQESPFVSVRLPNSIDEAPVLDLKCTLTADGFKPQTVERTITFRSPCSVASVQSCLPTEEDITVGLNSPTKPEYVVKVKIDSVPSGADIYALGEEGYLGEKLGTTPTEFDVGFANNRLPDSGLPDPAAWSSWAPTSEEGLVTLSDETPRSAQLNFVVLKEGYARQDITRWAFHTPDVAKLEDVQRTITIPLKTHDEARQERMERIEQTRTQLAAALRKTELDLKQTEISNQQELIRRQELISRYLAQLNTAFDRASTSSPGTITLRQDPHYNREWQDSMAALGTILRPHSKLSPLETEQNIQALEGLGSLIDLMNR